MYVYLRLTVINASTNWHAVQGVQAVGHLVLFHLFSVLTIAIRLLIVGFDIRMAGHSKQLAGPGPCLACP